LHGAARLLQHLVTRDLLPRHLLSAMLDQYFDRGCIIASTNRPAQPPPSTAPA